MTTVAQGQKTKQTGRPWTSDEFELAVHVFAETRSFEAAARAVGRTVNAVKIRLRRRGVTHRSLFGRYSPSESTRERIRLNRRAPRGPEHPSWKGGRRIA